MVTGSSDSSHYDRTPTVITQGPAQVFLLKSCSPTVSNISEYGSGTEDCAARVREIVLPRKNVAAVHINANVSWHPR